MTGRAFAARLTRSWISTSPSGSAGGDDGRDQARVSAAGAAVPPEHQPGRSGRGDALPADRRGLRDAGRSGAPAAVRHGRSARAPAAPAGGATFAFEGFDFSVPAEGADGVDVRRSVRRRDARGGAGRRSRRDARRRSARRRARHVRRRGAGRVGARHGDAAGCAVVAAAAAGACGAPRDRGARRCEGSGPGALRARAHGVRAAVRALRGHRRAARSSPARRAAAKASAMRTESIAVKVPPGVRDGERLRLPRGRATRGATAAPRAISTSRCTSRRIRSSGARATTCTSTCRWRCTKRRSARASTCRSPTGPCRCAFRRARSRVSSSACASAACRRRAAGRRAIWSSTSRLVLPPLDDERSRALVRELAGSYPDDVRQDLGTV